ncbi:MAG: exonuclease subunit SbcD [Proteobacteria bacterium]|nr:exonuclease subunit SbcD [Pseudomonadota bacterium]
MFASKSVRILHTSDWHLGRTLHEKSRDEEYDKFLCWLLETIERERIDVLLVAGDIFDTSHAPHAAQQKYYDFCHLLMSTCCRHAVITSGNHDSAAFIDVPGNLLRNLNVHVVGQARFGVNKAGNASDEVIVLKDDKGSDILIVAAVPFLSDGDIRLAEAGEDTETREEKMRRGMALHYGMVAEEAERVRAGRDIPVVAMGHLYVTGGRMLDDDGVRTTYVGSLGGVGASIFSPAFDYVALGHLHVPQCVGGNERIRYSGSPIPMGFGEAGQQKSVCMVTFKGRESSLTLVDVPCFQKLARVVGNKAEIKAQLTELMDENEVVYVSVTYTGSNAVENVAAFVHEIIGESDIVRCLYTQNQAVRAQEEASGCSKEHMTLAEFTEENIFSRLLDYKCRESSPEERQMLTEAFTELLIRVKESS